MNITLKKIKEHGQFHHTGGWETLLKSKGKTEADDVEFPLTDVLESNGLDAALWCLRCLPEHDEKWRLLAVSFAREVQHLMKDERSIKAIDVAERYAVGKATYGELTVAKLDARDTAYDTAAAAVWSVWSAFWAAYRDAAWASLHAVRNAYRSAEANAEANAEADAEADAARDAEAWDAARAKQEQLFRAALEAA